MVFLFFNPMLHFCWIKRFPFGVWYFYTVKISILHSVCEMYTYVCIRSSERLPGKSNSSSQKTEYIRTGQDIIINVSLLRHHVTESVHKYTRKQKYWNTCSVPKMMKCKLCCHPVDTEQFCTHVKTWSPWNTFSTLLPLQSHRLWLTKGLWVCLHTCWYSFLCVCMTVYVCASTSVRQCDDWSVNVLLWCWSMSSFFVDVCKRDDWVEKRSWLPLGANERNPGREGIGIGDL